MATIGDLAMIRRVDAMQSSRDLEDWQRVSGLCQLRLALLRGHLGLLVNPVAECRDGSHPDWHESRSKQGMPANTAQLLIPIPA